MRSRSSTPAVIACALTALLVGCAATPSAPPADPFEPVNRAIFKFNRTADKYVLEPVASAYDTVTPDPVQDSVGNFFDNAHAPVTIVNSALQANFAAFNYALGRFMINTVAGIGGLFDVASAIGVPDPDEDLGQTFAVWNLPQGPYLVLPLLGPSTVRAAVGSLGDRYLYPVRYLSTFDDDYQAIEYGLAGLNVVDARARYGSYERLLKNQFDPYVFLRSYYLKNRRSKIENADKE